MLLTSSDAFWLRAETRATPAQWAAAFELAPGEALTIDALRAHVAERLQQIPWASWGIHQPRLGRHRWLTVDPLPLERLVFLDRTSTSSDPGPHLARIGVEPFDPDLPLWRVRLVDCDDGRQLVLMDAHHAFAGGYVAIELFERLFAVDPRHVVDDDVRPPRRVSLPQRVADGGWAVAAAVYRTAARMRPATRWQPARSVSRLVGPVGPARVVATVRLTEDRLRAIGEAYGAGTTRVVIALLARALDAYGESVDSLRVLFPHGTQEGPVTRPGNAARSTFLDLPLHLPPAERLAAIKDAIIRGSTGGEPPAVCDLTLTIPPPITAPLGVGGRRMTSVALTAPLRVCSHAFTRLTVVVEEYAGDVSVTFTADRDGLGHDVPALCDRLRAAVDELEAGAPKISCR